MENFLSALKTERLAQDLPHAWGWRVRYIDHRDNSKRCRSATLARRNYKCILDDPSSREARSRSIRS